MEKNLSNFIFKFTGNRTYMLYKSVFVNQQRYSADAIDTYRSTHDGCLLYEKNNVTKVGFLKAIIYFADDQEISLVIQPVNLQSTADTLSINGRSYRCTNILYGTPEGTLTEIIDYQAIIQKLAFRYGTNRNCPPLINSMFFFQFPNLASTT